MKMSGSKLIPTSLFTRRGKKHLERAGMDPRSSYRCNVCEQPINLYSVNLFKAALSIFKVFLRTGPGGLRYIFKVPLFSLFDNM